MIRIATLFILIAGLAVSALAQEQKVLVECSVSKFAEGVVLTREDIGFINLITHMDPSRPNEKSARPRTIQGRTFHKGQQLTKEDAEAIQRAALAYKRSKDPNQAKANDNHGCENYAYYKWWNGHMWEYFYFCK